MIMNQLFFIKSHKVNHKTIDSVMEGCHIELNGYRYEQLNKRPFGRSIERRLRSMDEQTQLVVYK